MSVQILREQLLWYSLASIMAAISRVPPIMQGGTCVLVGDTPSRVAEAAKYAKKLIGCEIMESTPYYRSEGHVQVPAAFMSLLQCQLNSSGMIVMSALHVRACLGERCLIMVERPEHRVTAMQKKFNNQTLAKRCMSTVQLLIDIESLAHADYMTGTLNSGIPYLIEVDFWLSRLLLNLTVCHRCLPGPSINPDTGSLST